jgi:hypothetical protein
MPRPVSYLLVYFIISVLLDLEKYNTIDYLIIKTINVIAVF